MEQQDWMGKISETIAGEVRRNRLAKGLSAQQLSDRCSELGAPIPRTVLSNLENGRRTNVTVAEVLVLGYALGVPPGALIFPVGYVAEVEAVPDVVAPPMAALQWLSGEGPVPSGRNEHTVQMLHMAIFYLRQVVNGKRELEEQMQRVSNLHAAAYEAADQPELEAALEKSIHVAMKVHRRTQDRVSEFIRMLADGLPEMNIEPIPFPDVEPAKGRISISLSSSAEELALQDMKERLKRALEETND